MQSVRFQIYGLPRCHEVSVEWTACDSIAFATQPYYKIIAIMSSKEEIIGHVEDFFFVVVLAEIWSGLLSYFS